jgi:hypothetical protein
MAIKNYTTRVGVYESLGEIQGALAANGARRIMVEYDTDGQPTGVTFAIETAAGLRAFSLPANVEGVRAVMIRQKVKQNDGQAERTAWRNVRDWILAQAAIIEAGMVQVEEVFLPYMTDSSGRTLYQLYQGGQLALGGGKE